MIVNTIDFICNFVVLVLSFASGYLIILDSVRKFGTLDPLVAFCIVLEVVISMCTFLKNIGIKDINTQVLKYAKVLNLILGIILLFNRSGSNLQQFTILLVVLRDIIF